MVVVICHTKNVMVFVKFNFSMKCVSLLYVMSAVVGTVNINLMCQLQKHSSKICQRTL